MHHHTYPKDPSPRVAESLNRNIEMLEDLRLWVMVRLLAELRKAVEEGDPCSLPDRAGSGSPGRAADAVTGARRDGARAGALTAGSPRQSPCRSTNALAQHLEPERSAGGKRWARNPWPEQLTRSADAHIRSVA